MKKYKPFILVGIFIVFFTGFLIWLSTQAPEAEVSILDNDIILFYGDGCPHCEEVDDFIEDNDIADKVSFTRLEVWNDKENARVMNDVLEICDIDPSKAGVPLLFSQNECHIGTPDIETFFKNAAGI